MSSSTGPAAGSVSRLGAGGGRPAASRPNEIPAAGGGELPPPSIQLSGPGSLIRDRWKLIKKIGHGAFGEIYSARNLITNEMVAIKFERAGEREVLKLEVAVLKKLQSCPYVVRFISCGRHKEFNFMVMELLGENISELRRAQPNGRFSMLTSLKLSIWMLRAIEKVHKLGFLHRDIKPSNYAMGLTPTKKTAIYLIDFGLARRYVLPNGAVRPPRETAGFRGTARYASINSHLCKDLGQRDDLWSLLYVMVEFIKGQLPWRRIRDKDAVGELKKKYLGPNLVSDMPVEFLHFMQHLQTLRYADNPDYRYLTGLLTGLYQRLGGDEMTPFDWEVVPSRAVNRTRPVASLKRLALLKVASMMIVDPELRLPAGLPSPLSKHLLDFFIRIYEGQLPRHILTQLLSGAMTELDLQQCKENSIDYAYVASVCTQLRSLSLGAVIDQNLRDVLSSNTSLTSLSLRARNLSTKGLKYIAEHCPQLQTLHLIRSERVADKHVELLLRGCPNLRDLSLSGCRKFKGAAFKVFAKARKHPAHLESLDLSYCELPKTGFRQLLKISSSLQSLKFSPLITVFKIHSADFHNLIHSSRNLQSLEISNYHVEMDAILIEVARCCGQLTHLLLDGVGMTDYGLQNVLQCCSRLETIKFRYGDGVTDASLNQIAKSCPNITSLSIDFHSKFHHMLVADQAIRSLLTSCSKLTDLALVNSVSLSSTCFPEAGHFPLLRSLNVSECPQLNDFAVRRIADSCPNLQRLYLNNINNLTHLALDAIALGCPVLEELHLTSTCCFKDDQLKTFLKSMPMLFVRVTRYLQRDLSNLEREVHALTVDQIFADCPNVYRELAFERKNELRLTNDMF